MDKKMRDITCESIEVYELWWFIGKKQRPYMDVLHPSIFQKKQ